MSPHQGFPSKAAVQQPSIVVVSKLSQPRLTFQWFQQRRALVLNFGLYQKHLQDLLKHRLLIPSQRFWFSRSRIRHPQNNGVPSFPRWFCCCCSRDHTWGINALRPSFSNPLHSHYMLVISTVSWTLYLHFALELENFIKKREKKTPLNPIFLILYTLILIEFSRFSLLY